MSTTNNDRFDEFSPKKLLLQGRSAFRYLLSQWYKILGVGLLLGIVGFTYSYFKKPTYTAEITFALDEGAAQSSERNNFSALAQELGFSTSMNAGGVFGNLTNILELLQSRLLIDKTLKKEATIDGHKVLYADFFLDSLDYRDEWMKKSPYYHNDFRKPPKDKNEEFFRNNIFRSIHETLIAKNIAISSKRKGTSIYSVKVTSRHELFSKYFLEALMEEVSGYYIESKTQRAKINLDFIQKRTDSIRNAYNSALYGRATFTDANINPARQTAVVPGEKQQTDVQILKASYIDLVNALEDAKTALMRDTPLIQYLDVPLLPLRSNRSQKIKYFAVLFVVGCVITAGFLFTRKLTKHILNN